MQKYYRRMAFVPMLVVVWTKENSMGKMSELCMQIEELLAEDYTASEIADRLDVDIDIVYDVMDAIDDRVDCDDSDDGYALASAGFGTDEDYGYYGDE